MIKRSVLIALALFFSLAATALAAGESNGTIQGSLVNGTANGSSVAGQTVTLKIFESGAESGSVNTTTDDAGSFMFGGLPVGPDHTYRVSLSFQGVAYSSGEIELTENATTRDTGISVWDTTDSPDSILVVNAHTIVYTTPDRVQVTEYYLFANDGDRTYTGSNVVDESGARETLAFSLPAAVDQFQTGMGLQENSLYASDTGFVDTVAVMPGMKEISFSYALPISDGEYVLPVAVNYPTMRYDMLVQGSEVMVDQPNLQRQDPMTVSDEQFIHYSGQNLPAGVFHVSLTKPSENGGSNAILWTVLLLVIAAAAFIIYYSYYIRRRRAPAAVGEAPAEPGQQELLAELARLDDDFENGDIQEEAYRSQRDQVKTRLLAMMNKADGGEGGN